MNDVCSAACIVLSTLCIKERPRIWICCSACLLVGFGYSSGNSFTSRIDEPETAIVDESGHVGITILGYEKSIIITCTLDFCTSIPRLVYMRWVDELRRRSNNCFLRVPLCIRSKNICAKIDSMTIIVQVPCYKFSVLRVGREDHLRVNGHIFSQCHKLLRLLMCNCKDAIKCRHLSHICKNDLSMRC